MDYKTSGVDIIKGRSFVEYLKVLAPKIGGFSGMMEVPPNPQDRPVPKRLENLPKVELALVVQRFAS